MLGKLRASVDDSVRITTHDIESKRNRRWRLVLFAIDMFSCHIRTRQRLRRFAHVASDPHSSAHECGHAGNGGDASNPWGLQTA